MSGGKQPENKGRQSKSTRDAAGSKGRQKTHNPFSNLMGLDEELASEWLDAHAVQAGYIPAFLSKSSQSESKKNAQSSSSSSKPRQRAAVQSQSSSSKLRKPAAVQSQATSGWIEAGMLSCS